jgi:probable HAF family extracellular repeat protein
MSPTIASCPFSRVARSRPERPSRCRAFMVEVLPILSCLAVVCSGSRSASAQCYAIRNVGVLPGVIEAEARDVNNAGAVVGWTFRNNTYQGFLYVNGILINLGSLGGQGCVAEGINDAGQVVGAAVTASGQQHAFFYAAGQMIDLGSLGGTTSAAYAINNAGQVTGYSAAADGSCHLFIWQNGIINDLGHLGATACEVWDINNTGAIIGLQQTILAQLVAFLWTNTVGFTNLGTFGGTEGHPYRINDSGQIVGSIWNGQRTASGDLALQAFSYRAGGTTNLGTLGGARSEARGVNNLGVVVGWSDTASGEHAFIYDTATGMRDLNSMISPTSGWTLEAGTAINDAGQIAGTGRLNGLKQVFLLTLSSADTDSDGLPDACEASENSQTPVCGTGLTATALPTLLVLGAPLLRSGWRSRRRRRLPPPA